MLSMMALIPDSDKSFETKAGLEPGQETATVFGDKDKRVVPYPGGLDLTLIPLVVPQFRFGLPKGNELMVRYMPPLELSKDLGTLDFWGVGLKHSIDQWIPLFPLHVAVQGAYQSFTVGDLVSINSMAFNARASKKLLMLTLYGGLGWEETMLEAEYTYTDEATNNQEDISFDIKGDNDIRMTVGLRWAVIPFVHVCADYTMSKYQIITLGFGAQF